VQNRFRSLFAVTAALVAFGLPAARAELPGAGISFPAITKVEHKLNLSPAQKAQFDVALNATRVAFAAIDTHHKELKAFAERELATARPNLELLAVEVDDTLDQGRIERHKAQVEWLKLYAMLSGEQVAIVKVALQEKLTMMSWIRDFAVKWFVTRRAQP
jgi:hypothetical protein